MPLAVDQTRYLPSGSDRLLNETSRSENRSLTGFLVVLVGVGAPVHLPAGGPGGHEVSESHARCHHQNLLLGSEGRSVQGFCYDGYSIVLKSASGGFSGLGSPPLRDPEKLLDGRVRRKILVLVPVHIRSRGS